MSLTSFLKENADVRDYLQTAFQKPTHTDVPDLQVPASSNNGSIIGTAFDYLARLMVQKANSGVEVIERNWVAEKAIVRLPDTKSQELGKEIVRKARASFKQFLKNGDLSDDVIRDAVFLAQLDIVFRTRRFAELVGKPPNTDEIVDLRSLVTALPLDQFKAKTRCFLNPAFGDASRAVGGADGDLIIDDLLLDIKVMKDAAIRGDDFQPLIGYYLLYEIGGIDGIYYLPRISRVGFYFARHRLLTTWTVSEMIGSIPLEDTIKWLRQRLNMEEALRKSSKPKMKKK